MSMSHYCGIDFGTSNSVVTILSDGSGEEAGLTEPIVIREPSLIFFPEHRETTTARFCGNAAISRYLEQGMRGRFFQSVKTILPENGFTYTLVNGKKFAASDLVAVMLRFLREKAERRVGAPIRRAVFGRPVRFGTSEEQEATALQRLQFAIRQAGFTEAYLQLEPVAGAYAYAASSRAGSPVLPRGAAQASGRPDRVVLVADHGGGTSDFTLFVLGHDADGTPMAREVLASHGIRAGGDDFDGAVMWNRLVSYFGYGSHYESFGKYLPIPVHIYHIISRWDQIHFLKTLKYREELRRFLRTADNPLGIRRLIKLVEEDLGYSVFRAIEAAKISLSESDHAAIEYENGKLRIAEPLSRGEFESYIAPKTEEIADAVDATLVAGGIDPSRAHKDVSTVFLTGGSSRVPAVRRVVAERFGADRVVEDMDQFQSVSRGLALFARRSGLCILDA
jgi:hypothetical chaperone protein